MHFHNSSAPARNPISPNNKARKKGCTISCMHVPLDSCTEMRRERLLPICFLVLFVRMMGEWERLFSSIM